MRRNSIDVKIIKAEETRSIRYKVLWPHRESISACTIDIDEDDNTMHIGAIVDDEIIGVATLFQMKSERMEQNNIFFENSFRLRAMAISAEHRNLGAGKAIILLAIKLLREMNVDVLWCDAREVALNFYVKIGFTMIDEWYDVPIIGAHKLMYFKLK